MAGRPPRFPLLELEDRVARAAAREFSERGYDAATIDAIVAASGVSKPVIYRTFGSKSNLYCTMLERFADAFASAAMSSFRHGQGTVVEQLRAIIDSWFAALEERSDEWRMLNSASSSDPAIRATLERVRSMRLSNDIAMVRAFLPQLPEAQVEPIAEAIRGSLIAIGTWWLDHPTIDRHVPVDAMTRLCAGLLSAPTARRGRGSRQPGPG
jgi:AcrR family transcriptional regulator